MAAPLEAHSAWLLHSRPFRDTSLLLEFLTPGLGRVAAVARGVRSPKSRTRALLQPFRPLSITLAGRGELLNLRQVEARGAALVPAGERLFAGLYMNELLVRLLPGHESEVELFELYGQSLAGLAGGFELEPLLRRFELRLLELLGYGLQFDHEAHGTTALQEQAWYYLGGDGGFVRQLQSAAPTDARAGLYPGEALLRIAQGDFQAESTRVHAKRLLREALAMHLSARPLFSRELFRAYTTKRAAGSRESE